MARSRHHWLVGLPLSLICGCPVPSFQNDCAENSATGASPSNLCMGGATSAGGSMTSGGSISVGGAISSGGSIWVGGSMSTGGSIWVGGSMGTGGTSSMGGVQGLGGTTSPADPPADSGTTVTPDGASPEATSDMSDCDGCGQACPAGQEWQAGQCQCVAPTVMCGTACVDVTRDPSNCGACGHSCGENGGFRWTCSSGACVCAGGFTSSNLPLVCGTLCTGIEDPNNCMTCGNVCPASSSCAPAMGGCICPKNGKRPCTSGTICPDLMNDPNNCGNCGKVCPTGQACNGGICCAAPICTPF